MKANTGLFVVLLVFWMGASTFWYVCKIKNHCNKDNTSMITSEINLDTKTKLSVEITNKQNAKEARDAIIAETKKKLINGYTVFDFPENSIVINKISRDFYEFAEDLKLYLIENNQDKIILTGHTDNIGTDAANMHFGKERARFIKNKLIEIGISDEHFIIESKGEKEPIQTNENETDRTKNRRVVIKLSAN